MPGIMGLIFTIAGLVGIKNKLPGRVVQVKYILPLIIGPTAGIGLMWFQFDNRQHYQYLLNHNQAWIAEGVVENFHPMPKEGHSNETFTVNGTLFAYSDYTVTPAFNKTASHGGPIKQGLYVRIHYTDSREFGGQKAILRIELKQ